MFSDKTCHGEGTDSKENICRGILKLYRGVKLHCSLFGVHNITVLVDIFDDSREIYICNRVFLLLKIG